MRWFGVVFVAVSACGGGAAAPKGVSAQAPPASAALPSARETKPLNTSGLSIEVLTIPTSRASVHFVTPLFGA
ncbi:MAG TPA: hypothetical protein VGM44_07335, partial [Polyangiaceae bacterium]